MQEGIARTQDFRATTTVVGHPFFCIFCLYVFCKRVLHPVQYYARKSPYCELKTHFAGTLRLVTLSASHVCKINLAQFTRLRVIASMGRVPMPRNAAAARAERALQVKVACGKALHGTKQPFASQGTCHVLQGSTIELAVQEHVRRNRLIHVCGEEGAPPPRPPRPILMTQGPLF